ncbi:hypothetical protein O6H91_07G060000 [Diphasiastrum complanatum]|uniref:Uncharacterized protein n=2 Tax=Diphasiastrum complanatum TaxID=34168 RepID=A0ACC2D5Y7_DIPCM|nr:hypothetical protein O6H91_07G060000 [Diphasiastrum complanatum]KAJ7549611.1 hypothetical protein O6H91_07G060000 [Diphasiastrum complanatum]
MLTDPYHIILEESFISASQEELLANIPGWDDEKCNQRLLFEFTPSQALPDDSPATKSTSRSRSSDDVRSSGEGISGVFPGQQPVVWMSPPDTEEEQTPMDTNAVDSYKNAFESDRSQSPRAVSSVIGLGASCRELVFMDMSVQPFTQPPLTSNTPLLDTEVQVCVDDEKIPADVVGDETIPSDVAGDNKGSGSLQKRCCEHDANDGIAQDVTAYSSGDISPLKVGVSGNASPAQAMRENSPKSPSNQMLGDGCRSLGSTPSKDEANNIQVHCEKEQNKKEQRLVLSRVICSPHKVTTKELLAAIEELQEEDDESQEAHEARLFSGFSQVPIVPAALLSSFLKSGRQETSFPPKRQSLQQLSMSCAIGSGKTDNTEVVNAEKPKNDSFMHEESCIALQDPDEVLDRTVKSKVGYHPSESILQTSSLTEKEAGDQTTTLPKRSAGTLEQGTTVIVRKKVCGTARCERAHIFPKTVMDVVRLDSESDEECATGYDFLDIFLNSGLSLPLQLHR